MSNYFKGPNSVFAFNIGQIVLVRFDTDTLFLKTRFDFDLECKLAKPGSQKETLFDGRWVTIHRPDAEKLYNDLIAGVKQSWNTWNHSEIVIDHLQESEFAIMKGEDNDLNNRDGHHLRSEDIILDKSMHDVETNIASVDITKHHDILYDRHMLPIYAVDTARSAIDTELYQGRWFVKRSFGSKDERDRWWAENVIESS